ncbi:hypothetical protein AQUCO_00700905v1 [Aquilegia coerulea]|uniref:Uncharacterized protein n=1 Tax=Aquilegia coerulea TaxID=218851 RepID=A0A2G5EM89_AQUCA|nr:hypothetical protein AQUCO_00700905v1 [Aquilegia coerulea]
MGLPDTVQVLEQCRIAPPTGSSISTTSLLLTFLDLPMLVLPPIERIFFYEFNHSKSHFMNTILPNIKHSLSLALQHYYPLAGSLTWSQEANTPKILYTIGDTVSLTVAECDHDFYHLAGYHARDDNDFHPLVPMFGRVNSSDKLFPVMALQVTLFPNKGICIGIKLNHAVADGRTSNQFMKLWASFCKLEGNHSLVATDSSLPLYDRSIVKDPKELEKKILKNMANANITRDTFKFLAMPSSVSARADPPVRATFVIGQSDVKKLKQWVLTRLNNKKEIPPQLHLSTFVLGCAYVWVCLIKTRWGADDVALSVDQEERFAFVFDCRSQLNPPVPTTYFGNCLGFSMVICNRKELLQEDGIAIAAELLGKKIQSIRNDPEEIWKPLASFYCGSVDREHMLGVAGSPKLNVYETDFGWGKPKKVEITSTGSSAVSLSEHPIEERALEIGLVLSKKEMDAFASLFENNLKTLPA